MKHILKIIVLVFMLAALTALIVFRIQLTPSADIDDGELDTEPTETAPEVEEYNGEDFLFSFVGDNTLDGYGYQATTGGKADYPYANTKKYFDGGEFNFANLECIYSDAALYSSSLFHFKAPTKNTAMLTWAGIDFVTTANNHTMDYGQRGLDDTVAALESAGLAYGLDGKSTVYVTEHGIRIGIFCAFQYAHEKNVTDAVAELQAQAVDFIICAFHWGTEGSYRPTEQQKSLARTAIDAGADLVYGSHPHVLQPVEEYGDGLIIYSLANWSFGGNSRPADMDTAIVQLTIHRSPEGEVSIASYELIPCRVSSVSNYNDYCPTPYDKGTADYERCLTKLLGTFTGANLVVDYSHLYAKESEAPQESEAPELTEVPQPTPDTDIPDTPSPEITE